MSEVYRTLPEFPDYEITSDGDLRNKWSKRKLKETQNKNTGAWHYSLRRRDKTSTCRNFWGLIYSAWPELKPVEKEPEPVEKPVYRYYATRGQWVDIPGYPKYQAHPEGHVRYKHTRKRRKLMSGPRGPYYVLFDDEGAENHISVHDVLVSTFPETAYAA
jgi:hypothetical protein